MTQKDLIFMEHDGAVDDLLSQLLLMTMEDKEIIGMNEFPSTIFLHNQSVKGPLSHFACRDLPFREKRLHLKLNQMVQSSFRLVIYEIRNSNLKLPPKSLI